MLGLAHCGLAQALFLSGAASGIAGGLDGARVFFCGAAEVTEAATGFAAAIVFVAGVFCFCRVCGAAVLAFGATGVFFAVAFAVGLGAGTSVDFVLVVATALGVGFARRGLGAAFFAGAFRVEAKSEAFGSGLCATSGLASNMMRPTAYEVRSCISKR